MAPFLGRVTDFTRGQTDDTVVVVPGESTDRMIMLRIHQDKSKDHLGPAVRSDGVLTTSAF